jgi:hypothetical protein
MKVVSPFDEALIGTLTAALPLNSTLQELSYEVHPSDYQRSVQFRALRRPSISTLQEGSFEALLSDDDPGVHVDWSPTFSALGRNTRLKTLSADV